MSATRPAADVAAGLTADPRCRTCAHFCNDPHHLERSFPGWRSLGSAFGSARADDGICDLHGLYLSARQACRHHAPRGG